MTVVMYIWNHQYPCAQQLLDALPIPRFYGQIIASFEERIGLRAYKPQCSDDCAAPIPLLTPFPQPITMRLTQWAVRAKLNRVGERQVASSGETQSWLKLIQ